MNILRAADTALKDVKNHWSIPAEYNYVSYKEIACLSFGRMGMRLARTFGLTQEDFVCNTLGMSQMQRVFMGYITTAISLVKNLVNGYILDNNRSIHGRFRGYIRLGIPAGIILLLSLLLIPFDRLAQSNIWYMIIVSYSIDQIQGYISGWYDTGVCGLSQVITPNVTERTKVMAFEGLIHNIAPTITDIAVSMLLEKSYGFYDIRSFRVAYPPFIIIGTLLSLMSFYGTKERALMPKTRMTKIGFTDAFRQVWRNKIFRIKMVDGWNDFLEGAKGNILKYVYTYGEVSKGTSNVGLKYGLARDLIGSASFFAMAATPSVIKAIGKGKYKFYKNIIQIFLLVGMKSSYKKHVLWLILFLWLDKIVDTASVIDTAIEADMKDYQHYISGERIDGAFQTVKLYINTGVNAVTDLFLPWVKKKYGLTNNYDDFYNETFRNRILDVLLNISVVGAIIDCVPYYFYDISETEMKSISGVLKVRTLVEDGKAGIIDSMHLREGIEALELTKEYCEKEKCEINKNTIKEAKQNTDKKLRKAAVKQAKADLKEAKHTNELIETASFINSELNRFRTPIGMAQLELSRLIANKTQENFWEIYDSVKNFADNIEANTKQEKYLKSDLEFEVKQLKKSREYAEKYYPDGIKTCSPLTLENALNMPNNTREQHKIRQKAIRAAERERSIYGKTVKPWLTAKRTVTLAEGYADIYSFAQKLTSVESETKI